MLLLSGCLSTAPPECTGEPCTNGTSPVADLGLADLVLSGCEGIAAMAEAPREAVQAPQGFEASSSTPTAARFLIEAYRCERAVGSGHVVTDAGLLITSLIVRPHNDSWAPRGTSSYLLDVLATDASLVDDLLERGLPAREGRLDVAVSPAGDAAPEEWTFQAGEDAFVLRWSSDSRPLVSAGREERHLWTGANPYRVVLLREVDRDLRPVASGVVTLEGSTRLQEATGLTALPLAGERAHTDWTLTPNPAWFQA